METEFFKRVPVTNGLFKTTCPHRLDDVNRRLLDEVILRWSTSPLRLLDVGVSSGITTAEWADSLRSAGRDFTMVGTDLALDGTLQSFGRLLHVLRDSRGFPLQFEVVGCALGNHIAGIFGRRVKRAGPVLACRLGFLVLNRLVEWRLAPCPVCRPVRMLSRRAMTDPNVKFVEEDLLGEPLASGQYHVIRAANVLNPRFFAPMALSRVLHHLGNRLGSNGVLVVIRTHEDGTNHGGAYEKDGEGSLRSVLTFGGGAEIHDEIVALRLPVTHAAANPH